MTVLRSLQLEFVPVVHKLQRLRNAAIQIKMYLLSLQTELGEITNVISTVKLLETCYIYCQVTADMSNNLTVLCQRLVTR